jgi:hypothetical protein
MSEGSSTVIERQGPAAPFDRRWLWAGALVLLALVPLTLLGPGTDLDVGVVIRSGRAIVEDQDYVASRPPGAPVHEAAVGLLDRIGGTVATNLGSLAMAVLCTWALVTLLRRAGVERPGLAVAVVVANPFFLIAATSTVDFLWALGLLLTAAVLARDRRPVAAGVLAALAIGCRASTVLLVAAVVLAEWFEEPEARRRACTIGAIAVAGGALLFVPSYLAAGESLAFAQNEFATSSPLVQLGKYAVKNLYFFGPAAAIVLGLAAPPVLDALRRWRADWTVRFAAGGLVLSQLLFLRFPWKLGHLLPTLVCLALLLGIALGDRRRLLVALVAAQLLYAVVNVQFVRPDNPNEATGGRLTFAPAWGALVVDVDCREDDTTAWESNDRHRLEAVWNCAKPWAGGG